jgi:RHS repeat-associated protein
VLGGAAFEITGTGAIQRVHVTAGGKEIAQLATDGGFYWLHTDHLGTPRKMTNGVGVTVFRGEYDPHGNPLLEWSTISNNKFTGYERDAAAGIDYAQARHYKFGRGKFMQPDPVGLKGADTKQPQSFNRYSYSGNDPINHTDIQGTNFDYVWGWLYGWYGSPPEYWFPTFIDTILAALNGQIASSLANIAEQLRPKPDDFCPKTANEMTSDRKVRDKLNEAWNDTETTRLEQGGWIFQDPKTGELEVRRTTNVGTQNSIDLGKPPSVEGKVLVGTFHTHPSGSPRPSDGDIKLTNAYNLPDVIVKAKDIFPIYGPVRRGSNPDAASYPIGQYEGYPGSTVDNRNNPKCTK